MLTHVFIPYMTGTSLVTFFGEEPSFLKKSKMPVQPGSNKSKS